MYPGKGSVWCRGLRLSLNGVASFLGTAGPGALGGVDGTGTARRRGGRGRGGWGGGMGGLVVRLSRAEPPRGCLGEGGGVPEHRLVSEVATDERAPLGASSSLNTLRLRALGASASQARPGGAVTEGPADDAP